MLRKTLTVTFFSLAIAACSTTNTRPVVTAAPAAPLLSADQCRSDFQKDRQAVLAMAGEYRVDFHFEETVAMRKGYELKAPYEAQATEFVKVIEDTGEHIALQHILVVGEDEERHVVKHWRQDWDFEKTDLYVFTGHRTWELERQKPEQVQGAWTQSVYQVDDSPRYQSYGCWQHQGNQSVWESEETWRPLPRREYTKRDDYDVLVAVNRHILMPDGWVHEQDNYKLDLSRNRSEPVIAREFGLNTYTRIEGFDFSAGYEYWDRTQNFWAEVRYQWHDIFAQGEPVQLRSEVDGEPLFRHFFDLALNETEHGYRSGHGKEAIRTVLNDFKHESSEAGSSY